MKKFLCLIITAVMIVSIFTACSKKGENSDNQPSATETSTKTDDTSSEPEAPDTGNENLLTGKLTLSDEAVGKRPVAVMVNNIKASLPQYGISSADIIYEIVTEGGITRLMAIFGDYTKIPNVCSIRSCRYYFPIFAYGYDAVYFCFGANADLGYPTLKRLAQGNFDYVDGKTNSSFFSRDKERLKTMATEHTAYLKGAEVPKGLDNLKIRTDILEGKNEPAFNFTSKQDKVSDKECKELTLSFSSAYYSTFKYNSEKKVYYKWHSGSPHKDSTADKQLSFTNVFVLQTSIHNYKNKQIVEVNWKGGDGYYISNGTVVNIKWEKPTEDSAIKFTNAETGKELSVNPGKSYIGVIPSGRTKF